MIVGGMKPTAPLIARSSGRGRLVAASGLLGIAMLAISGCGSGTSSSSGAVVRSSSSSGEQTANGEGGGGDAAGAPFVSSRFHYRVTAPGAMSEASDGTASTTRGTEQLSISVVTGASAKDARA